MLTNCSNNYGPWQNPEKLIPNIISKALLNDHIPIYGNGKNVRDWLYVDDHIDAILLVADKGIPGKNYCIGGNNEKTNIDVVNKICQHLDEYIPQKNSYKNLIKFVSLSNISEVKLKLREFKITIKTDNKKGSTPISNIRVTAPTAVFVCRVLNTK